MQPKTSKQHVYIYNLNVRGVNSYVWQLAVYSPNHLQGVRRFIDACSKKNKLKIQSKLIFHPALFLPTNFSRRHVFRSSRIPNDKYIIFVFIFNSTGVYRFLCNKMFFFTFFHCARYLCWTVWISLNAVGAPWKHKNSWKNGGGKSFIKIKTGKIYMHVYNYVSLIILYCLKFKMTLIRKRKKNLSLN